MSAVADPMAWEWATEQFSVGTPEQVPPEQRVPGLQSEPLQEASVPTVEEVCTAGLALTGLGGRLHTHLAAAFRRLSPG